MVTLSFSLSSSDLWLLCRARPSLSCCHQSMCTLSKPPHADERLPHICARLYQALDWFPEQTHQKEKNTADGVKPSRRFSPKKGRECFYLVYLRMSERRDGLVLEVKVRSCELDSYQIQQDPGKLSQGLCHHLK